MRYDLTDFEWSVIEPLLPKDRRGRKPKNNRRVLNGIFYILRTGAMAGSAGALRALHDRLQSLQPLAQSREMVLIDVESIRIVCPGFADVCSKGASPLSVLRAWQSCRRRVARCCPS
jgi:Putative transposase of IS4/5 family (DUF4096)